ncbi:zinc finger protein 324A-like isoform X1 [Ruditapes philippinarum]|uniref:zinc finger protein 324A-like isoform X1 n=1 Tax=Ruditapes philippinarum TaxID=129788 RepID=UPI00295B48CD|nr:zinc finger protein 324A-like isoform X1 [Ruditapes philippinarum]
MSQNSSAKTQWLCGVCGRTFSCKASARQHERRHNKSGSGTSCCGKLFFSKANLTRHRCSKHGEERLHSCPNCEKKFATNADLARHLRTETKAKQFECDICRLKLSEKSNLQEHLHSHEAVANISCKYCKRVYRHRSSLSRHLKKKHDA